MKNWLEPGKEWIRIHEYQIIVAIGLIIVSVLSFELGILRGAKWQTEPILIEKIAENTACPTSPQNAPKGSNLAPEGGITQSGVSDQAQACPFVGSKNSDKLHVPTCTFAKRIKPENQVCFSNLDDALAKGRVKDKCIK